MKTAEKKFIKGITILLFMGIALSDTCPGQPRIYAAPAPLGIVIQVDKTKREVHVSNPRRGPLKMGEILSLWADGQVLVLRVSFPMINFSRCVVEKGGDRFDKINKGMPVYQGIVETEVKQFEADRANPDKMKIFAGIRMTLVPAGENIKEFYMGMFEVTRGQYESVMGKNPNNPGGADFPAVQVSWYFAVEFCNKLSEKAGFDPYYTINKNQRDTANQNGDDTLKWKVTINKRSNGFRLPTSEEWEHAYRAGSRTQYYWSDDIDSSYCWYSANSGKCAHPVGKKKPNAWGLYDMSGNVWEWCFEWHPDKYGSCRVVRGGSWSSNAPRLLKASGIHGYGPQIESRDLGFRLVRSVRPVIEQIYTL